jgi:uncharacterized membrane protein YdbT with pleckstrin-like domain
VLARPDEQVHLELRRHGIVLARPLGVALFVALGGAVASISAWPLPLLGAAALAFAALAALRAVWRWERTHVVVTAERLFVAEGTLRRRAEAVRLQSLQTLALEQNLAGRLLGYGTIVAGPLELHHVPEARRVYHVVERLAA